MLDAALLEKSFVLASRLRRQCRGSPRLGEVGLMGHPRREDEGVVSAPEALLDLLEKGRSTRILTPKGVHHLGCVAQSSTSNPQLMKLRGFVSLPQGVEGRLDLPSSFCRDIAQAAEDGEEVFASAANHNREPAPEARDRQVQQLLGHAATSARAGAPESSAQGGQLGRDDARGLEPRLEQRKTHVEIPTAPPRPSHVAEDRERLSDSSASRFPGQKGERRAQPASGHAHLVDLFLLTREALGEMAEQGADALLHKGRGAVGGVLRVGHRAETNFDSTTLQPLRKLNDFSVTFVSRERGGVRLPGIRREVDGPGRRSARCP